MSDLTRSLPAWLTGTRWNPRIGPGSVAVVLLGLAWWWLVGGLVGGAVWAIVAITWLLFPPTVAVAVAQFGLVVLLPAEPAVTTVLLAETPVVLLLVADLVEHAESWLAGVVLLGLSAVGVGTIFGIANGLLVPLAISCIGVGGIASYLLHLYLLVRLGLF